MFSRGIAAFSETTSRNAETISLDALIRSNVTIAARVCWFASSNTPARIGSRTPFVGRTCPTTGVSAGGVISTLITAALRFDSTRN